MVWDTARWAPILLTERIPGNPRPFLEWRKNLINEAVGWPGGESVSRQLKCQLPDCSDGSKVYFLKPGKEVEEGVNQHDMLPVVEINGLRPRNARFSEIWSELTKIALADEEAFRAMLLLVYRSAYLLDHEIDESGKIRYLPNSDITGCISELNRCVGPATSFGSVERLLRFIDLLGWNEDVKYHTHEGSATFTSGTYGTKDKGIGRINTLLTCIRVPSDTTKFVRKYSNDVREGLLEARDLDYTPLYDIMQAIIDSKGVCIPRRADDLLAYLSPYLARVPGRQMPVNRAQTIWPRAGQRTLSQCHA